MNLDVKQKITTVVVFVMPLLLVKVTTAFLGGPGPETATASSKDPPIPNIPQIGQAPEWSDEELLVSERLAHLRTQPFGAVPIYTQRAATRPTGPKIPTGPEAPEPPPVVTVNGVFRLGTDGVALIDGKQYHEGDSLGGTSWIVSEINVDDRTVTISDSQSDRKVVMQVLKARAPTPRGAIPR